MTHLRHVNSFFQYCQDAMPITQKKIHVINTSAIVRTIFSIVKPFIYKELRESIFFHASTEELSEIYDPEILPTEFGGSAGAIDDIYTKFMENLEKHAKLLDQFDEYKIIESQ